MTTPKTEEPIAIQRYGIAKLIQEAVSWQPAFASKVWDIYIDPYSYRITVVVEKSARADLSERFSWVPNVEFVSFNNAISIFKFRHRLVPNKFGLSLSELEDATSLLDVITQQNRERKGQSLISDVQSLALQRLVLAYTI